MAERTCFGMSRPIQPDGRLHGVAVAIRRADGRCLAIRRSRHVSAPLKVCFPGGAVELGESQPDAVIREMREELGILVRPVRCFWSWRDPGSLLTLFGWIGEQVDGTLSPDPLEIEEVLWLTPNEIAEHPDALRTNRDFVAALLEHL